MELSCAPLNCRVNVRGFFNANIRLFEDRFAPNLSQHVTYPQSTCLRSLWVCVPARRVSPLLLAQHMQSHVEFRTGEWHEASEANLRAVALPGSDAVYPDHNMDMLM